MSRSAALRASLVLLLAALAAGTLGAASGSILAQAMVAILASAAALAGALTVLAPTPQPVPVRVRARRHAARERL
ncbi:hypothetical protein [Salinarimonas soli]|uniref:Uncharacterized protein n=1 Tax=Salinarimonas soli TaxID=1638099 RepID=A0A5B2VFI4_9HYPH|nr:hypothetical protein [Salinarimonas soli]KAA2237220.1 hypothetical protein F0L46_09395 [Salinarimonas soli]